MERGIECGAVLFGLVLALYAIAGWLTEMADRKKQREREKRLRQK